jgi:hypothetical protein
MSGVLVLLFACAQHNEQNTRRFVDTSSEDSEVVRQIETEEGTLVSSAIATAELEMLSLEAVEFFKNPLDPKTLPAKPVETAKVETKAPTPTPPPANTPTQSEPAKSPEPPKTSQPPPAPKPSLPPEIKAKLSACYPQWERLPWANDTMVEIREFKVDVQRLRASHFQMGGSNPEVVFIDIQAEKNIAKVSLSMMNKNALYCVDIDAGKAINKLDLINVCGSRLGVVTIDAGRRARKVTTTEICP